MKILVIQTAFLGDVVLATAVVEQLRRCIPDAQIDFLVRKGNEGLLAGHPLLRRVWIWDKKEGKYRSLWRLLKAIRRERYDRVVNCQRFLAAGLLTVLSGARETTGFDKNPVSRLFTRRLPHRIGDGTHEVDRNLALVRAWTDGGRSLPRLYPSAADVEKAGSLAAGKPYVCIAPTSVWFTKQWPAHKWVALIERIPENYRVYLLGAPSDTEACAAIAAACRRSGLENLAGRLGLLESAALMAGSAMNYVNDSAPMHLASAMNAPVAAVFCSTVPAFGFGPLSERRYLVETTVPLECRPCGLHGHKACPQGHFNCAESIPVTAFPIPG